MCSGLELATMIIGAIGATSSYVSANAQANAQERYEMEMFRAREEERQQNAKNAVASYVDEAAQSNLRQSQRQEKSAEELQDLERERREKAGEARASSLSSGLGLELILGDLFRQQGRYNSTIESNLHNELAQDRVEIQGLRAKATDRINSIRPYIPRPVNKPSPLSLVADIGSSVVGAKK